MTMVSWSKNEASNTLISYTLKFFLLLPSLSPTLNVLVNIEEETRYNGPNSLSLKKKSFSKTRPDCFTQSNPTKHRTSEAKNARAENNPKDISPF